MYWCQYRSSTSFKSVMLSKIIFVLAAVCVVNASVFTVNVFDDDPETEFATNPSDCNFRACDQLCRRLGFPSGVCVKGRCKCDNFLNAEDGVSEKTLSNIEDSVSQKDNPETEFKSCNFQACDQLCRRLKFPGGACVNGRCKCDNFLNTEDAVSEKSLSELEDSVSPRGCNNQGCHEMCLKLKLRGGTCIEGRCVCKRIVSLQEDEVFEKLLMPNIEDSVLQKDDPEIEVKSCNFQACDQLCRRLKFPGGACVNGRCKCDNFLNTEDAVSEKSLTDLENSVSPSGCNNQRCNELCLKLKLRGGTCIEGRCVCKKISSLQKDAMTDSGEFLAPRDCNFRACDQQCRRLGFPSGVCVNGRCKCDNFLTEDTVSERPVSNLEDSVSPKKCTHQACNELCRKLKFREGVCIAGRCSCNNYFPQPKDEVSENSVSESSEDLTERGCNLRVCEKICCIFGKPSGSCVNGRCKCNKTEDSELVSRRVCRLSDCRIKCNRRGYEGAKCVNTRCKCYNKTTTVPTPLIDANATSDEHEETLILKTNEEELTVPARSACNTVDCNQMCHRLNYAGGMCSGGICKCY